MIRIDDTLLEEIGLLALPKAERDQMLRQIYETLEMRVGMKLAERMTDQQLDEFERFIDTNDEAGALKWLETNFPDYKQVVADELNKLKEEIKKDSNQILQAMQGAAGQMPAGAPPVPVSSQAPTPLSAPNTPQPTPNPASFSASAQPAAPVQQLQSQPQPQPMQPVSEPAVQPLNPAQPLQPQPSLGSQSLAQQPDPSAGFQPQQPALPQEDTQTAQSPGSVPPPPA